MEEFNALEGRRGRVRIKVGVAVLPLVPVVLGAEEAAPLGPTMVAVMTLVSEGLPWVSALPPPAEPPGDAPHTLALAEVGMGPNPSPY